MVVSMSLQAGAMSGEDLHKAMAAHPAAEQLQQLFPRPTPALPGDFQPTRLTRKDYLRLAAGNVDFWKQHQSSTGAILDYVESDAKNPKGLEKQYSTPAFALAAATLIKEAGREDLLDPAIRALDFSLTALLNKTTANQHADFYISMLVHAHRILKTRVPAETAAGWKRQFNSIIPQEHYRDVTGGANWNVVNVAGEALRRKEGLVAPERAEAQQNYLDAMLHKQQRRFTPLGMYEDPNAPLAYDAFPRMWLQDMLAAGAYDGPAREPLEKVLATGGFSSLLLTSPSGEWASGGRSAHHQWNEAENAVIGEINAAKWKKAGRDDIAGAFKRMARMGLKSMLRWQRRDAGGKGGEMWIVKNFAEPQKRLGFEEYSFHSQYNLLPSAMLCIAYERADETIEERPLPAEYGTYVFDAREPFTQIVAAAGGYYVQINTNADAHYNATGLQRVHRRGVELSPLSDSAAGHRAYQAAKEDPKMPLTPGIQWKNGEEMIGLMSFHRVESPPKPKEGEKPEAKPQRVVKKADLEIAQSTDRAVFTIKYQLEGPGARDVEERYRVSSDGVECIQLVGDTKPPSSAAPRQFAFPVLMNDGARDTRVDIEEDGKALRIARAGGILRFRSLQPLEVSLALTGPRIPTHNGYVQAATGSRAPAANDVARWHVTLEPAPLASQ